MWAEWSASTRSGASSETRVWIPAHPEFTTVELYEAYADFHDMMDIAEEILTTAAMELLGTYR
jgi:lysyl-tRNA synthetase class II